MMPTYGNTAPSWHVYNSNSTGSGISDDPAAIVRERAKYKKHLEAIFATDCVCEDATCPACIAEHALYYDGDHELTRP